MGEPVIDAPSAVDQLAWWVQHGEELRQEVDMQKAKQKYLFGKAERLEAENIRLKAAVDGLAVRLAALIDGSQEGRTDG